MLDVVAVVGGTVVVTDAADDGVIVLATVVEVIVLIPEPEPKGSDVESILRLVEEWRAKHPVRRSKEEIDRYLEEERASWGDDE